MLKAAKVELTPLQKRLADLGKILGTVSVFLCVLLFGMAILQKRDVGEMLITAIISCGGGGAGGTSSHCDDGAGTFRLADGEGETAIWKAPAERGGIGVCQRCVLG